MKIDNPCGPSNLLPLLRNTKHVLVQPPLYIDNQINVNPAWLKWCQDVYTVSLEEAVEIAFDKSMTVFDGDGQYLNLIDTLDRALINFTPTRTGNEHRAVNNK